MIIDIIFIILSALAIIKGYRRGLIVAIFSMIAFIVGLAAAIKLSAVVAGYIGSAIKVSDKWLPVISFVLVFCVVVLLVRLGAGFIEKIAQVTLMGWLNRIGGILFFVFLYTFIFSVLLFYADQVQLLKPEVKDSSVTYAYIQPLGPKVINSFGAIVPGFKNMFAELKGFFGDLSYEMRKH